MDLGIVHGLWSLLILACFVAIVARVWSSGRRDFYERAGRIPLEEDGDDRPREPSP